MTSTRVMRRRSQGPNWRADVEIDTEWLDFEPRQKRRGWHRFPASASRPFFVITSLVFVCVIFLTTLRVTSVQSNLIWASQDPDRILPDGALRSSLRPRDHAFRDTTTFEYHWRIEKQYRRPDGVLKNIYLINDAVLGPTIEARPGDRLIIHVQNDLVDEDVSIHWHGLYMKNANDMDGASGVTQRPIVSGKSFTYDFTLDPDQHGTFWYHAHSGVQRADGLYGGFVIHQPVLNSSLESSVDEEHLLLIGDWYHRPAKDALDFYSHEGAFGLETVPDSVLVNGNGKYACSKAVQARPVDCLDSLDDEPSLRLQRAKKNILRIVNAGAYAGFSITMPGFFLTPLTVDSGHAVHGTRSKMIGTLHPGERVSVLVEPEASSSNHNSRLTVTIDDTAFKYENSALSVEHNYAIESHGKGKSSDVGYELVNSSFDLQSLISLEDQDSLLPEAADQTIVLYTMTQKLSHLDNTPRGFINHTTWTPQEPPLISLPSSEWNTNQFVPHIFYDSTDPLWIDVVLNNIDEDSHPFHLHGHSFWVLATYSSDLSWGSYNPFEDAKPPGEALNSKTAVRKDTFHVPRRGYAVLRFRADNPGLWMFHCHVLWHQATGMAMVFSIA